MKNKVLTITIIANIFFYLIFFAYEEQYVSSQSLDQLNKISIEEYNMSILTIDSNKKLISVITAIKLNNMNEEPFIPNFDLSKNNKMDFIRFSIPEGFSNLYLESTLPEGGFIEMNEGFALTASIPSGEQHLIFNYELRYKSDQLILPIHLPHGAQSVKIIIPSGGGKIKGDNINFSGEVNISDKIFHEYFGENYKDGEYLNLKINNLPTNYFLDIFRNLDYRMINLAIIISMSSIIMITITLYIFKKSKKA